jgi:hypothetical protein
MYTNNFSNEKMIYIKFLDLDELYNFCSHDFFHDQMGDSHGSNWAIWPLVFLFFERQFLTINEKEKL